MIFRDIFNNIDVSKDRKGFRRALDDYQANNTVNVSVENAFNNIGIIFQCIVILANALSVIPFQLFKRTENGRERATDHELWYLLEKRPNKYQTPSQFKAYIQVCRALWGNAYIYMEIDNQGKISALIPLNPENVTIKKSREGDYSYFYIDDTGTSHTYLEDEIIHIPYISIDGKKGKAPLEVARENAMNLQYISKFEGNFYKNGTMTTGLIEAPAQLNSDAKQKIKDEWRKLYGGVHNSGQVAVLDAGFTYKALNIPLKDIEFIASRKMNKTEIATIFNIPLFMLNDLDNAKFNNIEHQDMRFISGAIHPTCVGIEEEFNYKAFTTEDSKIYYTKFNLKAAMRTDSKTRAEYYKIMQDNGNLNINEIRELEDMNGIGELGDKYYRSLNFTTIDTIEHHERIKKGENNNEE